MKERHLTGHTSKELGRLFAGIALLLFSADVIVKLSTSLASESDVPIFVIGLVILAIGTSLPEFAFSIRSVKNNEPTMFLGNLLGSVIANSTLIVGLAAVIQPIQVDFGKSYLAASTTFILAYLLFWKFIQTKFRLERWEGILLILLYSVFIAYEFLIGG